MLGKWALGVCGIRCVRFRRRVCVGVLSLGVCGIGVCGLGVRGIGVCPVPSAQCPCRCCVPPSASFAFSV